MIFSADQLAGWTQGYYWPFLRLSALFLASPIFSASSFPVRGRVILAVLITALIMPSLPEIPVVEPLSATGLLLAGQQVVIGLAMGFILQMVFGAVVIAGQTLSMTMGLGFAMAVDPQNGVQVPVLSQLYVILATLIFLSIDGHLILIQFLVDSFTLLPIGLSGWRENFGINVVLWGSQMFLTALLLVLPALTAVLLINVAFGVVTRAAPQLNIFAVGFPVTIMAGFVFITLSMPTVFSRLVNMFDAGLAQALSVLH
ncbi:MAG: flagellar biosynthetic protein FliR [Porticoccus sp.]|nr:flagellar biosynthetic protein FliR [Porticoccus sp.]